jgi:hypothetical protein
MTLTAVDNQKPVARQDREQNHSTPPGTLGRPKRKVFSWAELLRRVFAIEIFVCGRCGGDMQLLAYISEAKVVEKILTHLGQPTSPLPLSPARLPAQLDLFDEREERRTDARLSSPIRHGRSQGSRAPPEPEDGEWMVELDEPFDTGAWGA